MIKKYLYAGLALVMLGACSGNNKNSQETAEDAEPVVKLASVEARDVDHIGVYTATVEPELINNISSSQPNRIKQILVDDGMRVSQGQRLVVLDDVNSVTYETQLDNARANLANVEANYKRAEELFKIGGGTRQQVENMEVQLINARNAVAAAERSLRNIRENTVLTSPISGVVTARNYDPGDMTGAMPILTVARINPVKIVINVSESELSAVHVGMPATVTFDTYGDEKFTGKVTMVAPTVDSQSRTRGVEITVPNGDDRLLPGMFGRVTLNLGVAQNVVVPDKAVVKQPGAGSHYIYVYNSNGTVSYRKVELGRRLGAEYEIVEGIDPGSRVVISGQNALADGVKVKVAE